MQKIKCRKIEKIIEELEMEEMDEKDKGEDDTKKKYRIRSRIKRKNRRI